MGVDAKTVVPEVILTEDNLPIIQNMAELMPNGFFVCEAYGQGLIRSMNYPMVKLLGCSNMQELQEVQYDQVSSFIMEEDFSLFWGESGVGINDAREMEFRVQDIQGGVHYLKGKVYRMLTMLYGEVLITFVDDITELHNREREIRENANIILGLNQGYSSIILVDMDQNTFAPFRKRDDVPENVEQMAKATSDFAGTMKEYAERFVFPEDREHFLQQISVEMMRSRLKKEATYGVYFKRLVPSGEVEDFKLTICGLKDDQATAVLGFKPISKQVKLVQRDAEARRTDDILRAIADDYVCLCDIDMKTGHYQAFYTQKGERYRNRIFSLGVEELYQDAVTSFLEHFVEKEKRDELWQVINPAYIQKVLQKEKEYSVEFDIILGEEKRRIQAKNMMGDMSYNRNHMFMGIRDITDLEKQRVHNERVREEQMSRLSNLSRVFYAVFYVHLNDDTYQEITADVLNKAEKPELLRNARAVLDAVRSWRVQSKYLDQVKAFMNLDTIQERLKDRDYVSIQYEDIEIGWVEAYLIAGTRDADGKPQYIFWAVKSIAETKQIEIESKRSLEELRDVISSSDMGTWRIETFQEEPSRMYVDERMRHLLGIHGQDLTPEEVFNAWYGRIKPEAVASVESSIERMRTGIKDENTYQWMHPFFGERYVRCGGKGIQTPEGYIFRGYHYDVTDAVEADLQHKKALSDALGEAQRANYAKSTFLFNMSHDIRTPMNAIMGYADLLSRHNGEVELQEKYIKNIQMSGHYLLDLINNVLEMSRIESGTVTLTEEPANVTEINSSIAVVFGDEYQKKNLTVHRYINVKHPNVYVDITKAKEIFLNIVSNSIKYTPDDGTIFVDITDEDSDKPGYVNTKVVIADTGIGMSKEFLPHIFDTFVREKTVTENKIVGTGLGMGIVKKYIDMMNGTIEIESSPGKGTKTTVVLPLRIVEDESELVSNKKEVDISIFEGKRILLAEDNDLNAEIAMELLSEIGLEIERAEDGEICVDMLEKSTNGYYDLILMDIQMPHMDGIEATWKIRNMSSKKRYIPIVAMTANAFEEDKRSALDAGMNGFVAKPIEMPKLIQVMAEVLETE